MTEKKLDIPALTAQVPITPDVSGFSIEFQNAILGLTAARNNGQLQSIERESLSEGVIISNEKTE